MGVVQEEIQFGEGDELVSLGASEGLSRVIVFKIFQLFPPAFSPIRSKQYN